MWKFILYVTLFLFLALASEGFGTGLPGGLWIGLAVALIFLSYGIKRGTIGGADNPLGRFLIGLATLAILVITIVGANELNKGGYWDNDFRQGVKKVTPVLPLLPPEQYTAGLENDEWAQKVESIRRDLESGKLSNRQQVEYELKLQGLERDRDSIPIDFVDRMVNAAFGSKKTIQPVQDTANLARWAFIGLCLLGFITALANDKASAIATGIAIIGVPLVIAAIIFVPQGWQAIVEWFNGSWQAKGAVICLGLALLLGFGWWAASGHSEE
jgi:hypothetical protein